MGIRLHPAAAMLAAGLLAADAQAADSMADAEKRIGELEKQMSTLVQTLQEVQQQLQQARAEKGGAEPVRGAAANAGIHAVGGFTDGLALEDDSRIWRLQLNGGVQGDYRHFTPDRQNTDTFSVRHARLSTTLSLFQDFSFRLEGEYANDTIGAKGTTALTNGYFDFTRWPEARLRVGQFRPLFGLEHITSDNLLGFQERSLTENLIQDLAYDRGVMLHGTPFSGAYYSVALTNGTGQNMDNTSSAVTPKADGFDTIARLRVNAAEWLGRKDTVLHLGGSYNRGTLAMRIAPDTLPKAMTAVTAGRCLKFFDPAGFNGSDVDRRRWDIESAWAYGPVKLQAEYMHVDYQGTSAAAGHYDRNIQAWYAEASWLASGESYPEIYSGGLFGRIQPRHVFNGAGNYGAVEFGVRYSRFDASDFRRLAAGTPNPGTGVLIDTATVHGTNAANDWAFAANWIFNPFVRVMANYVHTDFDTPVVLNGKSSDHEDVLSMRAQLDF